MLAASKNKRKKIMGTFSKSFVKTSNIIAVKETIEEYYKIESEELLNIEQGWMHWSKGSDTIIISQNYNKDWTEISLNFFCKHLLS